MKFDSLTWTDFTWISKRTSVGVLWTRKWNILYRKIIGGEGGGGIIWLVEEMLSSWQVCSMWRGCWFGWVVMPCYRIVSIGMLFCINNKSSGAIGRLEFFTSSTATGFSAEYGARLVLRRISCWNTKHGVSPAFVFWSRHSSVYSCSTLKEMYQVNHFYTKSLTHLVPNVSAERSTARVECNT